MSTGSRSLTSNPLSSTSTTAAPPQTTPPAPPVHSLSAHRSHRASLLSSRASGMLVVGGPSTSVSDPRRTASRPAAAPRPRVAATAAAGHATQNASPTLACPDPAAYRQERQRSAQHRHECAPAAGCPTTSYGVSHAHQVSLVEDAASVDRNEAVSIAGPLNMLVRCARMR